MKVTITLEGDAARQIIQAMAYNYAMLTIKSRLELGALNAPWGDRKLYRQGSALERYNSWMRKIDRTRGCYKRALLPLLHELPEVPPLEMKVRSSRGKFAAYIEDSARLAARTYAKAVQLPEETAIKALGL